MILLKILKGKRAGHEIVARLFPFQIGRAAAANLALDDDGVWESHLEIDFLRDEGFRLRAHPGALVSVNGQNVQATLLRNGDVVECGSAQLRFWLAPTRQRSLKPREWLTWLALGALFAGQIWLIYRLL